jgi:hypothetical protein
VLSHVPWYGTTYNLALELHPLSSYLERAIEQRHTLKLDPAAELSTELKASISQAGK